ncbi:hypothetical protein [Halorientalis pallida]|uniref:hypothetical protein n=1 Tax=Halorientalis pallida TaxID=2479928 RepID=UPI001D125790|nr:hypothetical protein [Halorientalis pallida]
MSPRSNLVCPSCPPVPVFASSCDVLVSPEVVGERRDITQCRDIHGGAAGNVLAARTYYTVEDPYGRADTPDSRPTFGLNDGETDVIVLANAVDVDGSLTDEFGGTNFPLIHAVLQGPRIVPTPRLICDYARNGHLNEVETKTLLKTISPHRGWEDGAYVTQLLHRLEGEGGDPPWGRAIRRTAKLSRSTS